MQKNYNVPSNVSLDRLGKQIPVQVRQSARAKHISIRINYNKVELVIPDSNFTKAYNFLLNKEAIVRKKLKSYESAIDQSNKIPILGTKYIVTHIVTPKNKVQLHDDGNLIIFSTVKEKMQTLKKFLVDLLLPEIKPMIDELCTKMGVQFYKVRISSAKTNWGSCSAKKTLSFNWRLIFTPLRILHYVIVHEVCHLIEMNHGNRFWQLVSNLCPDYKEDKRWLKQNTFRLQNLDLNLCI